MKSEIEITEIVKRHGGRHLQFGNVPSWSSKTGEEGIELITGKIGSFWYKDNARVYGEPSSDEWQKCIDEVMNGKTEEKKPELVNSGTVAMVPDVFTMPLMEKWKKMTTFERMLMFQKTNPENIEERKAFEGKKVKYVTGNFMLQELNIAFLFNWSSTIEEVKETETGYWVRGHITVKGEMGEITRAAIGTADKHKGVNSEDVAKAAAMDMIKKAASSLGFNGDVYRGEV